MPFGYLIPLILVGICCLIALIRPPSRSPSDTWYVEPPGGQHGFDALYSWRTAAVIDGIDAFLNRVRADRPTRTRP